MRQWILDLPFRSDALQEARHEWHFEQQVYRELLGGHAADARRHSEIADEALGYSQTLQNSVFALCPSGSGPNSIRLWEALGYGTIPVILSDCLALPGDPALWRRAALLVAESPDAVAKLPGQLELLRQDQARLSAMQAAGQELWQRYGLPDFVADLRGWMENIDNVLLANALRRFEKEPRPALLIATEPASLPLQLRQQLRQSPPEQPLIVQHRSGASIA